MSTMELAASVAAALPSLTQLRALHLTGTTTLDRLPAGVSALTALTSLVVDMRMRDRGPEGPDPEDFAPLGRGGGGDAGLLRCFGLRRLVVRGFNGPLHLPEGMERFSLLEVGAWLGVVLRNRAARDLTCLPTHALKSRRARPS
jgi:hypothetical protein